jgi:hypothetical protein
LGDNSGEVDIDVFASGDASVALGCVLGSVADSSAGGKTVNVVFSELGLIAEQGGEVSVLTVVPLALCQVRQGGAVA